MSILKYYYQNKNIIWIGGMAIIVIIIAIQTINGAIKKQNNMNENNIVTSQKEYQNNLDISVLISDTDVKEKKELIIDQFIRYCNAKEIEKAYSLLSQECKEELYPTLKDFEENYYNVNFSATKLYSKELFRANTYKIKLYDDVVKTGTINTKHIEDYYTMIKENDENKLNISNYIETKESNKRIKNENLEMRIIKRQIYKEYEQYKIEITNLTNKTIALDSRESTKNMYIVGNKDVKYYSRLHEIITDNLIVRPNAKIILNIKYSKEYNSNNTVKYLAFSDIILDYEEYLNVKNKSEYKNRLNIMMNI